MAFVIGNAELRLGISYHRMATEAQGAGRPVPEVKELVGNALTAFRSFNADFAGHPYIESENGVKYRVHALAEEFKTAFSDLFPTSDAARLLAPTRSR